MSRRNRTRRAPYTPGFRSVYDVVRSFGAVALFDPESGTTIATGVSSWVDRIGGYTLTQATGSQQPVLTAGSIGSKPALVFTRASNMRMTGAAGLAALMDNTDSYTIVAEAISTSPVNGDFRTIIGNGTAAATTNSIHHAVQCGAVNQTDYDAHSAAVSGSGIWGVTKHCRSIVYNGTTLSSWLDGVPSGGPTAAGTVNTLDTFVLGANLFNASYFHHFNGSIGCIAIFSTALSPSARAKVERAFAIHYA